MAPHLPISEEMGAYLKTPEGVSLPRGSRCTSTLESTRGKDTVERLVYHAGIRNRTGQRELTVEQARQAVENIAGFFRILAEWDTAEKAREKAINKEAA